MYIGSKYQLSVSLITNIQAHTKSDQSVLSTSSALES